MKIGIISTVGGDYSWAGSEEMWMLFALEALRVGHSVAVSLQSSFAASTEMDVFRSLGGVVMPYQDTNWICRRLRSKGLYSRFGPMKKWGPEVVCTSGAPASPYRETDLHQYLLGCKARQIHIVQGNDDTFVSGNLERQALKKLYDQAQHVICVSRENARLLKRQTASAIENCLIFPNPIRNRVNCCPDWPEDRDGMVHFATVGRYEVWSKCQDLTLEALATPEWKARRWRLNLYGSGPDETYIRDLIRYYGLEDRVFLMGFNRDFTQIWAGHEMHILNSRAEGLALALIESMFCGRPAIVTRTGGNHEVLRDGIEGYVSPGTNVESIRETLERAWHERAGWQAMGQAAYHRVDNWVPRDLGSQLLERITSIG